MGGKDRTLEGGYAAFLSYSHHDNTETTGAWASWLQEELESYVIPPKLVGVKGYSGEPIPEKIYPVFRDETSAATSPDLKAELHQALSASKKLIVICTPSAAQSPYIDEEIRYFKAKRGAENVIGIVVAGDPAAPAGDSQDCQPRSLRYKVNAAGEITSELEQELLFADFRTSDSDYGIPDRQQYIRKLRDKGLTKDFAKQEASTYADRVDMMKHKVIAGLLDIPLDDLLQREQLYQNKRRVAAEREALWTIAAFLTSPLLITATFEYNDHLRRTRFQDMDPGASLTQLSNLLYAQMKIDSIVTSYFVAATLFVIVTWLVRRKLSLAHLFGTLAIFLSCTVAAVVAVEYFDRRAVITAQTLDTKAANAEFIVDPCAPNLRTLYDPVRAPGAEPIPVATECAAGPTAEPRTATVGFWRGRVAKTVFAPIALILLMALLLLLGKRMAGWRS